MKDIEIIKGKKFKKEFKKLFKKYRSLENDLSDVLPVICAIPTGNKSKHWNVLKEDGKKYILKTRMMCRSLKSASFRLIYYYDGEKIELEFIEIYFKGNKESEDKERIKKLWEEKIKN